MGFLQLCLAFAALLGYAFALSPSLSPAGRAGSGAAALLAATGFTAATPQWTAGLVLMALAVAAFGLFAGASWLLAVLLGVGETRGRLAADMPFLSTDPGTVRRDAKVTLPGGLRPAVAAARPS